MDWDKEFDIDIYVNKSSIIKEKKNVKNPNQNQSKNTTQSSSSHSTQWSQSKKEDKKPSVQKIN